MRGFSDEDLQLITHYFSHWKQTANGVASREEEEISELQEDDRDQFSDQLASVGMLGRVAAEHCIPLLTRYTQAREPMEQIFYTHNFLENTLYTPTPYAHWSKWTETHS